MVTVTLVDTLCEALQLMPAHLPCLHWLSLSTTTCAVGMVHICPKEFKFWGQLAKSRGPRVRNANRYHTCTKIRLSTHSRQVPPVEAVGQYVVDIDTGRIRKLLVTRFATGVMKH